MKPTLNSRQIIHFFNRFLVAMLFMLISIVGFASDDHNADGEGFKAGPMIVHHIADAHSIHIVGHLSIPLPCIVHSHHGWDVFMSSVFMDHDHNSSLPFTSKSGATYVMQHEKIFLQEAADTSSHASTSHGEGDHAHEGMVAVSDFSITKSVFGMFMMGAFVVVMFVSAARAYARRKGQAPKGLQNFLEPLVLFIKDEVAIPALGKKRAHK
ncbi:MAG: hypothetical protein ACKOW8_14935, partial [Flavobacteriales bacterium]